MFTENTKPLLPKASDATKGVTCTEKNTLPGSVVVFTGNNVSPFLKAQAKSFFQEGTRLMVKSVVLAGNDWHLIFEGIPHYWDIRMFDIHSI